MAIWVDDLLPEKEKYLDLSFRARACLYEVWCYAKRSGSNGVVKIERLSRASDAFTPKVMEELVEARWWHKGGEGCGDDSCPRGIDGYVVLHDFTDHQESAANMSARIERRRDASRKANHKRWHIERGIQDPICPYCNGSLDYSD